MTNNKETKFEMGIRIKAAREKVGYTQEKFAEKIDRSVQYISDLERGKVGLSTQTLMSICNALYVSSDFILFGKQEGSNLLDIPETLNKEQIKILKDGICVFLKAFSVNTH